MESALPDVIRTTGCALSIDELVRPVAQNQNQNQVLTCEARGKYTYTGPAKPGVRIPGMCIDCSTDAYIANGGTCEVAQVTYDSTNLSESSPNLDEAAAKNSQTNQTAQGDQGYRPASGATTSSLSGSQRLVSAPERGNAGPEIMIYPLLVAMANGAYFLVRRRKK